MLYSSARAAVWHLLHLIASSIGFLLGAFFLLTAIILYPNEEGKIQSALENFWIRVDDYQALPLSRHAALMTGVAKLETRFLDGVFGRKLISGQALGVSVLFAVITVLITLFAPTSDNNFVLVAAVIGIFAVPIFAVNLFMRLPRSVRKTLLAAVLIILVISFLLGLSTTLGVLVYSGELEEIGIVALGGFACDVAFVAMTRRLLRWSVEMTSSLRVLASVVLSFLAAIILVCPLVLYGYVREDSPLQNTAQMLALVAFTNLFDCVLAVLFVFLAVLLLIHRAVWPLLTRTLFRMQDIGTKGRRAILTAVGLYLMGASGWKVPGLFKQLVEALVK